MMPELSLHVLDIVQNSISAHATDIAVNIEVNPKSDILLIEIVDNGQGMTETQKIHSVDPFFTTRTTRTIGLGIPFLKQATAMANGTFSIHSTPSQGTTIQATFQLSHIDRMPLGNISDTIHLLIVCNPNIHFSYRYTYDNRHFRLDTNEILDIIGDISLLTPEVKTFIKEYLIENKFEVDKGLIE